MEIKDWVYSIGLILTFSVSFASLLITIKNRKNPIREHLYKEQMVIYRRILPKLDYARTVYYDIMKNGYTVDSHEKFKMCRKEIHDATQEDLLIIHDDIVRALLEFRNAMFLIDFKLESKEKISEMDYSKFEKIFFKVFQEIRGFIGVEILSQENSLLISNKRTQ